MTVYTQRMRELATTAWEAEQALRDTDLGEALSIRAGATPDGVAVVDTRRKASLTYAELDRLSTSASKLLRGLELPSVSVLTLPSDQDLIGCAVAYVAALKADLRPACVGSLDDALEQAGSVFDVKVGGDDYRFGVHDVNAADSPGDAVLDPKTGEITLRPAVELRRLGAGIPKLLPMVRDIAYTLDPATFGTMLAWHVYRGRCGYVTNDDLGELLETVDTNGIAALLLNRRHYRELTSGPNRFGAISSIREVFLSFLPKVTAEHQAALRTTFPDAAGLPLPVADARLRRVVSRTREAVSGPAQRAPLASENPSAVPVPTPLLTDVLNPAAALYVELLIRVLTRSVFDHEYVTAPQAELHRKVALDREARMLGRDWPEDAETMIGDHRATHLAWCVASVVNQDVPGDLVEAGSWRGGSCILMRAVLAAMEDTERKVWVADSFAGFPGEDFALADEEATRDTTSFQFPLISVGLDRVKANFTRYDMLDEQVEFVPGWFHETLPGLPVGEISVLRLDGDLYDSTWAPLEALYPRLSSGGYCIVDDYGDVRECREAVDKYRRDHDLTEPIQWIDTDAIYWRKP